MSGLLPHNPNTPTGGSSSGSFITLTVGSLIVTSFASIANLAVSGVTTLANLVVTGTTTFTNLIVNGTATINGALNATAGVFSDVYSNFTPGSTVTLSTTGSNAAVLLSPDGTGRVAVKAGSALTADSLAPTTAGPLAISTSSNGNLNLSPNGTGLVVVTGGSTDGPITVNHTAQAGVVINRTDGGGTANGYRCTQNGTYAAEFGYNASTNEAYVACSTGNVKLFAGANVLNSTPQGITFIPTTLALPRYEIGSGNSSDIVLARAQSVGGYFSGSAIGDLALRHANTANSVRIGVGSGTAQVVIANALTTTTNQLLMNSPSFHPITVNNTSATSGNDILFQNSGTNIVSFGANQTTNEAYAFVFANQPFKIGTNSIERLRIDAAGIANNNAITNILGLSGTSLAFKNNVADTSTAQVFTNKTLDSASNTLTITNAPLAAANVNTLFNQALLTTSSPTFVTINAANANLTGLAAGATFDLVTKNGNSLEHRTNITDQQLLTSSSPTFSHPIVTAGLNWNNVTDVTSAAGAISAGTFALASLAIPTSTGYVFEIHVTASANGGGIAGFGEYRFSYRVYNNAGALVIANGVSQDKSEANVAGAYNGKVTFSLTAAGTTANLNITSTLTTTLNFGGLITIYK